MSNDNRAEDERKPLPFVFGTKAETLGRLDKRLRHARLCEQLHFSKADWLEARQNMLDMIARQFPAQTLAFRSSALHEDGANDSKAGAYESVIGVSSSNPQAMEEAIDRVFASYATDNAGDQILVQPRVEHVAISGVAMSRDLTTGAPYIVITYDDFSGRTDTVTGGAKSKTILVLRSRANSLHSPRMAAVIRSIRELETVTGYDLLDIEFCMTDNGDLFILQVRRMSTEARWAFSNPLPVEEGLEGVRTKIRRLMRAETGVAGATTIFGQMPDWNPAEMIGAAPRPLAYSLYRKLITDRAWAIGRRNMGYADIGDHALMQSFAGYPYIDVRLSLNSMLPEGLDAAKRDAIVDYQLEKLAANPELHDKIEFEISISCADFSLERRAAELADAGLGMTEISEFQDLTLKQTNKFLRGGARGLQGLLSQIEELDAQRQALSGLEPLKRIEAYLAICVPLGTVPFAELARHAFVAMSMLRSMEERELLTNAESDRFIGSIKTVAYEFVEDLWRLSNESTATDKFFRKYGHLRPGTYDILSPRYDEMPKQYLGSKHVRPDPVASFVLSSQRMDQISEALSSHGFEVNATQLFDYMAEAIRLRELSKFLFTRTLSDTLSALTVWGENIGISREDLAFVNIDQILAHQDVPQLREGIEAAKQDYALTTAIRLPHLIVSPEDVDVVRVPVGQPNYITSDSLVAPCGTIDRLGLEIDGRVVLIESADPGFDWIFSHDIAGLVTKFGGANSHMAIRCAEFAVPAAIGCGERLFDRALHSSSIELNCAAKTIRFPNQH